MYPNIYSGMEEELMVSVLSSLLTSIPGFVIGIAVYVFSSMSLYTLAKRRGLSRPWLSWIPVGNSWILGSLADQFRYVMRGETKSRRKVLLILNIISLVMYVVFMVILVVLVVDIITGVVMGNPDYLLIQKATNSLVGLMALLLPWLGVAIAYTIIRYIALYDLYTSCDPQNKTLYLVIGILVGATEALFLFLCRNKDYGMPPRKDQQAQLPQYHYQPPQYQQQPYQQPQYQQPQQAPQYQQPQYQPPQYQQPQYQQPQQAPQYQQPQYQPPQYQQLQYRAPQYQPPGAPEQNN